MNQKGLMLKIRKRTAFEWLTLWILLLPLMWGTLFSLLHVPGIVKYSADFAWVILVCGMVFRRQTKIEKDVLMLFLTVIGFFLYAACVYLFRFQSPLYFLWGFRNNFRYYAFFFAVVFFFKENDADQIFRFLDFTFWLNTIVTLIQYFVFDYSQDYLGGIFGTEKGCNAYTIIFLSITIGYSLLRYMDRQEKLAYCLSKCAVALVISAMAELKVFFLLFLIILVIAAFFTSFSWKKILIILSAAALVFFGATILVQLYQWEGIFSLEKIWKLATQENYSYANTVNRLSAIPTLAKRILHDPMERFFGLGLGNCETSTFAILNTPFYETYSYLRYTWFSCARLFLEIGYIGLVFYTAFFVMCFFIVLRRLKTKQGNSIYCHLSIILSVVAVAMMFYNSSLHLEAGYMLYFVLALPFATTSQNTN